MQRCSASEFDDRLRPSVCDLSRQAFCDLSPGNRVVSPPPAVNPPKSNTLSVSQVIPCTPNGSAPYCEAPCAGQVGPTMDHVFCATVVDRMVCPNLCLGLKNGTSFNYQSNNLHS